MIQDRFGRDHHEALIRKLFHIKQNGTVTDYVDQFSELVDQLAVYESYTDPLYYTMRFINGLRADIKTTIMVQRPSDLDTACSLALVQEEATESVKKQDQWKYDGYGSKYIPKGALPLPAPPRPDK
ncbi:hypothetical protein QOZ80_3AG0218760 [Eleusine coracana subsp. coracana]|nr:hypothetical protein QOZ80_3AG0218760 [Eleusine coracana subsp. coracana]